MSDIAPLPPPGAIPLDSPPPPPGAVPIGDAAPPPPPPGAIPIEDAALAGVPKLGQAPAYAKANPGIGTDILMGAAYLTGQIPESPIAQAGAAFAGAKPQDRGEINNAVAAAAGNLGSPFVGVAKALGLNPVPTEPILQADTSRLSGKLGGAVGSLGAAIGAGPAALPVFATAGAQQGQEEVQNLRATGQPIDPVQAGMFEVTRTLQSALQALPVGGRAAEAMEPMLAKFIPSLVSKWGPQLVVRGLSQAGIQDAGNLVAKLTVNPNQQLTEGQTQQGLFGVLGTAHEGLTSEGQTPQRLTETARPEATPKTPTPEPPNVLEALRQRMEAVHSEDSFGPDHTGTPEQVDQMHRERIAAAEKAPPKTPEQETAERQQQLTQLHPEAQIEPGPVTGRAGVPPEARNDIRDLEERLNQVERRVDTGGENQGRREVDLPSHEFKTPEQVAAEPAESLKSQLTPNETIREHAAGYAKQAGIEHNPDRNYEPVDTERAAGIAKDYEAMQHNPNDPKVKASYDALKKETLDQYNYLKAQGVKIEPWSKEGQPYANSKEMMADAAKGHLYAYTGGEMPADHPLAEEAPGTGMNYNSVFRAVHDYFGHAQEGNGFGPKGEEHAWKQHLAMYSDAAKPAMTAETRGQNSWVNYGPHGAANQANPSQTVYAPQKAGLLPTVSTAGTQVRKLGTGADTALNIRQALGGAQEQSMKFEAALKGARDSTPSFSKDEAGAKAFMDAIEKGALPVGSSPEVNKAFQVWNEQRQENAQRGVDLGIKNLNEEGLGASRMFEFPDRGGQGVKSLAGSTAGLKSQKYDTYTEAHEAAIANGGKPRFDNPWDAQIARQKEINKLFAMKENLRGEEDAGKAVWVPDKQKAPEGMVPLEDRILGTENRKESLPAWKVAAYGKMTSFEGQKYLDQHKGQVEYTRPGPNLDMPDTKGHAFTGREQSGTYYMAPEDAAKYNNMIEKRDSGLLGTVRTGAQALMKTHYITNLGHAKGAVLSGFDSHMADAIGHLGRGDLSSAVDSLAIAFKGGGIFKGRDLINKLTAGTAGDVGERVMAANPFKESQLPSVTDAQARAGFRNGLQSIREGNIKQGAQQLLSMGHELTFNHILPDVVAGRMASLAESHIARGISLKDGRAEMAQLADSINRQVGNHAATPDFKNGPIRDLAEAVIPAARFHEGNIRDIGAAFKGNKFSLVPKLMGVARIAGISAALQALMTYENTGTAVAPRNANDLLKPWTGKKDDQGNEIALNNMDSVSRAINLLTPSETGKALEGMLHPAIRAIYDIAQNKDFEGNQVMPDEGSTLGNVARAVGHVAKAVGPIGLNTIQNKDYGEPKNALEKARDVAMSVAGVSETKGNISPAQQSLYEDLHTLSTVGGRNLRSQDMHTSEARWAEELKQGRDRGEVGAEMRDKPWMNDSIAASVEKRSQAPTGIASLVYDSQLTPWMLSKAWDKSSPEEKDQMKTGLIDRMGNVDQDTTAADEYSAWETLRDKVVGK